MFLTKIRTSHNNEIGADDVYGTLGLIPSRFHFQFADHIISKDKAMALNFIQKIYSSGVDLDHFTKEFLEYLRKLLIHKVSPATLASFGEAQNEESAKLAMQIENQQLIRLISLFSSARNEIKHSPIPQLPLELALLDFLN